MDNKLTCILVVPRLNLDRDVSCQDSSLVLALVHPANGGKASNRTTIASLHIFVHTFSFGK